LSELSENQDECCLAYGFVKQSVIFARRMLYAKEEIAVNN